jgi:hypothetical protein
MAHGSDSHMDTDVRTRETGAPTDLTGGMPATDGVGDDFGLDSNERATLAAIADHFIPAAHGMPSAGDVLTGDRLSFVLRARPDLLDALKAALRSELAEDVAVRLTALAQEPTNLSALQLTIVGGYYTDKGVRERIGYPGQMAIEVKSWLLPEYIEEGLIDAVLARGAVWRDPATGKRAEGVAIPHTYAERYSGGNDGRDGA